MSIRVSQIEPLVEPAAGKMPWDYADSFQVQLDDTDDHEAELWLRSALDQATGPLRRLIQVVHRHAVRFRLDDGDENRFLGWRLVVSEQDVAAVEADGSLFRAVLVARRHTPTRITGSTYLFFHRRAAARLTWLLVRPIHLHVERRLLVGAARSLTRNVPARGEGR